MERRTRYQRGGSCSSSRHDPDGSTKLERLVAKGRWDSVVAGLKTQKGKQDARKRNERTGELLFHSRSFYREAPFRVVQALVEAYPEGIMEPEKPHLDTNLYPLLTAVISCPEGMRDEVVKLFVRTNPKCLSVKELKCKIPPIHDAIPYCDAETVRYMINAYPGVLYHEHKSFGMPIHHACMEGMFTKVDVMLDFAEHAVSRQILHASGMLPLHLASTPNYNDIWFDMDTFRRILNANIQAAQEEDERGRLPLHYACIQSSLRPDNQPFVSELMPAYQDGVKRLDADGNLPLHYLAMPNRRDTSDCSYREDEEDQELEDEADAINDWLRTNSHSQVEKDILLLMRAYPEALLQMDSKGRFILGTLAKFGYPSRQVWETASRICPRAFLCSSTISECPLSYVSFELGHVGLHTIYDEKLSSTMQDGELASIILRSTFVALRREYGNGMCNSDPLPSRLHQLAFCSQFITDGMHLSIAVENMTAEDADSTTPFLNTDAKGNTPLHLACQAPPPPPKFVALSDNRREKYESIQTQFRIDLFLSPLPEAARQTNINGKTPLKVLFDQDMFSLKECTEDDWDAVTSIIKANPADGIGLYTEDRLFPFILAGMGNDYLEASLSSTFQMLLAFVSLRNLPPTGKTQEHLHDEEKSQSRARASEMSDSETQRKRSRLSYKDE